MAATKITDLAKEWGLETKDLLSRLEKIGIRNRKAPNSLSDDEIQRASQELGLGEKRGVTIGEERVVTSAGGEAMVERRVGSKVIRRRSAAGPAPELVLTEPIEPLSTSADILSTMGSAEPMLESFEPEIPSHIEIPEPSIADVAPAEPVAEAPVIEAPVAAAPVAPVIPTATVPKPTLTAPPAPAPLTSTLTPPRPTGPRVLGRIDLKRVEPPRPVTTERPGSTDATRARRPAGEAPDPTATTTSLAPGKKKTKKRVIEKPEISEAAERDTRSRGMARKKRAMPGKEQRKTEITTPKASKRIVRISELITVGDLAKAMGVKVAEVVKKLMEQGMMATVNQTLDADTATLIASEFGYNVENVSFDADSAIEVGHEPKTEEALLPRPPVITIMGHVDHGKTSLLDAIRQTNVTDQEAGGITQHIGAYMVDVGGKRVTFLDTPGHEAFTAMRARGAKVTDLVVLVVAADDGVMPQTIEAINHARAAKVPIVVAINKIDKPESNLDRIKQELANHGLVPEEWGGDTITAPVSAKTKDGVPHLLEMLLLQAEVLELKANHEKPARGTIIEAKLDRGRGPVATVLVQEGTLKTGDPFVCGAHFGRVRAMIDDHGKRVTTADPSTPVEILGLGAVPEAGASFVVVADEAMARQVADHRQTKLRESSLLKTAKVTLEDLYRQIQAGDTKELRVVIKADVQGSAEALSDALTRLSTDEVRLNVIHSSVGGITESDVMLASASNAVVIGFNIRPEAKANQAAEREGVDLRLYTIIYDALNEIRDAMEGLLDPTFREKVVGRAEVREVFSIPNIGNIAGSFVTDGKITRNASARLVRDHVVVHESRVSSLRRFKDDAREVQSGYECGIGLENYNDLKAGDVIEVFEKEQVARRLGPESGRAAAADRA